MSGRTCFNRETAPFITPDDKIVIERGGGMGVWDVVESRYKDGAGIELLLRRGSQYFRTQFNRETMRVTASDRPITRMFREVEAPAKAKFKPKP